MNKQTSNRKKNLANSHPINWPAVGHLAYYLVGKALRQPKTKIKKGKQQSLHAPDTRAHAQQLPLFNRHLRTPAHHRVLGRVLAHPLTRTCAFERHRTNPHRPTCARL